VTQFEPVVGALFLAFDLIGRRPDVDLVRSTLPSAALFATAVAVEIQPPA
jgi:hypothetical protein